MVDRYAVRQACEPIARWWQTTQESGRADPDNLARAVRRARLLGPVPGPLGTALAYILEGCPDLDYPRVQAAFTRVTAAARTDETNPAALSDEPSVDSPVQLCFAGIPSPETNVTRQRKVSRR
jgi:hypothetical protein